MITRKTQKSQSNVALATALKVAGANKLYASLLGLITFTALLGVALPSENARATAQNAASALGGGLVAVGFTDGRSKQIQAQAAKNKALADGLTVRLADKELEAQQTKLALDARRTALDTFEATYKQRCENNAESRVQRQVNESKRKIQAECDRAARAAENKVKKAEKALSTATASHKKIQADASAHYQRQLDAAGIEKQVLADSLNTELAESKATLVEANQKLALAARELEALRSQQKQIDEHVQQRVAHVAKTVFDSQSQVIDEAAAESKEAIQRTALELQWEKQERLRLDAENKRIQAPKLCTRYGPQADMARKIHGAIHGITIERSNDGQRYQENAGFRAHFIDIRESGTDDVFMFEPIGQLTSDDLRRHQSRIQEQSLRGAELKGIEFNADTACLEFTVSARKKAIVSDSDFARLLKPESYYLARAAAWPRSQIIAASESGKTSSAEILGYQWTQANEGDRFFHYPNKESIKNYVTAQVASSGAQECAESFANLVHLVDDIQDGRTKPLARKQHHVFDDSDTVISKALDGLVTREEVLDFFTRASHCGIGFTLIGHSTAANRQGGMTHSDFNNLTRIYSGSAIMSALANTQVVSASRVETLKTKYEKIRDRFEARNAELGLITEGDSADPGAYRFALVIEANKAPYFCELPRLDLLSDSSCGTHHSSPQSHHNLPQQSPQFTTAVVSENSHDIDTPSVSSVCSGTHHSRKCRKCGGKLQAQGIVKSGKHQGEHKYVCRSQDHTRAMGAKTFYYDA